MGNNNIKVESVFQELEKSYAEADAKSHAVPKDFPPVWDSVLWSPPVSPELRLPPYVTISKPAAKPIKKRGSAILGDLYMGFHLSPEGIAKVQRTQISHGLLLTKATQNTASWNMVVAGILPSSTDAKEHGFEFCIGRKSPNDDRMDFIKLNIDEPGISRLHCRLFMDREQNVYFENHSEKNDITIVRMSDGLGHTISRANGIVQEFKIENRWFPIRMDLGTHVFRIDLFRSLWGVSEATLKRHVTGGHDRPPPRNEGLNKEWTFEETLALVRQHIDEYKNAERVAAQRAAQQPTSPSNADKQRLKQKQLKWVEKAEEFITQLRGCCDRINNGSEPSVGYGFATIEQEKWIIPQDHNMVSKVLHVKPIKQWTSYDCTWFANGIDRELKPPFHHSRMAMDGNKLCALTAQDLTGMGITNSDLQQKLLSAVQNRVFYQDQPGNLIYYPPAEVQRDSRSNRLIQSVTGSKGSHSNANSRHNSHSDRHSGHSSGHHGEHKHGGDGGGGATGNIASLQSPGTTRIHLGTSVPNASPMSSPLSGKSSLNARNGPAIIPPSPSSAFLTPASSANTTPTSTNSAPTSASPSASPALSPSVSPSMPPVSMLRPPSLSPLAPSSNHAILLPSVPENRIPAAQLVSQLDFNDLKTLVAHFPPPPPLPVPAGTTASGTPVKRPPPTTNAELLASVDFSALTRFLATLPPPATPPPNLQARDSNSHLLARDSNSSQGSSDRGSPKSLVAPPMPSSTFSTPMNSPPNSAPPTPTNAMKNLRKGSDGMSSPPTPTNAMKSARKISDGSSAPHATLTVPTSAHYTAEILATVDFDELKELLFGLDESAPNSSSALSSAPASKSPPPALTHVDSFSTPKKSAPTSPVSLTPASPNFRAPMSSLSRPSPAIAPINSDLLATRDFNELNFVVQTTH